MGQITELNGDIDITNRLCMPFVAPVNCYWALSTYPDLPKVNLWNPLDYMSTVHPMSILYRMFIRNQLNTVEEAASNLLKYITTDLPVDLFLRLEMVFRCFTFTINEENLEKSEITLTKSINNILLNTPCPVSGQSKNVRKTAYAGEYFDDPKSNQFNDSLGVVYGLAPSFSYDSFLDYYMPISLSAIPFKIKESHTTIYKSEVDDKLSNYFREGNRWRS